MPVIDNFHYKPPLFLRNGHLNTFYPYLFRKKPMFFVQRQRYFTDDNDFFDVDWTPRKNKRLAILLHGLEGSSNSQYIVGTTKALIDHQWDVAAINFRSCSGEMNKQLKMYHSGFTEDLHHFITQIESEYDEIAISGFSLGGNVTMKYLGDKKYTLSPKIIAVAGTSVPCDLEGGSVRIMEGQNHLYEKRFLETLKLKLIEKNKRFPDLVDLSNLKKLKTLWDFDEYYTSSLHGFKDAKDYYLQCSSLPYLKNISIPALMINALDDSFLSEASFPYESAKNNPNLYLLTPKYGGHVGFTTFGTQYYWNEKQIVDFFEKHSSAKRFQ